MVRVVSALVGLVVACSVPESGQDPAERARVPASIEGAASMPAVPPEPPGYARCAHEIAVVLAEPGLPGTPLLDGQRAGILARGMSHPSVFVREPERSDDPYATHLWTRIEQARTPAYELYDLYPTIVASRERARAVLLREGYLYADETGLGLGLATVVRLEHLFREPEVFIHRGARILRAERRKAGDGSAYFYADGPEEGNVAQILLLDRVAANRADLEAPLHVDLVPLARQIGFQEALVEHMTERRIVARLRYGARWIPTVLDRNGTDVILSCEMASASDVEHLAAIRAEHAQREAAFTRLREVIYAQIVEGLPFDEPKTEFGQQDGKLRQEWLWAYRRGSTRFEFNEDRYYVFDRDGRPRVPQVCIDFIRDTYERAAGSWFQRRGEPRERRRGSISFREFELENDRSVESFVAFAESRPEWFDVWHLPEEERIPLVRRPDFYRYLHDHRSDFRVGDVVTILGLRDDGKLHYHSFFVFMNDPVTGMPTLLAANAGRPRIRSWEGEMRVAPYRSIKTRIRPKLEWLERLSLPDAPTSAREPTEPSTTPI